ncbi:glucose PTS transporter subunit IIA [Xylocopilactobacillus apis]|uniref:PTS beta-glucoside transporter subunit EIIBCA n=1 Tax=Xylocopilactobacillus apis TaxID=2932183 RepID=A0AAU9CSH4_9LACO|nr:glucose PTS transporter subunit IIA [Xylocopilactobacillus apis]BDR56947.1 PTS beta-glucoside transporter subunit EIIBCA [Xylocopilactobacillus apis]
MDYEKLAKDVVNDVGGVDNIEVVTHCMTRLRFNLKDVSLANKNDLENLPGVLGVVYAGEQYMVILGKNLLPVYEQITKEFNLKTSDPIDENLDHPRKEPLTWKNAGNKIIGFISSSITPLIPGLIAGGMLKVVLLLIVTFINQPFSKTSGYQLISAIADAPFYFMPIIVAYGAATKLGATPVYAMVATASLLHNNFLTLVSAAKPITLFGISVRPLSYGSTLLPALLIALVCYYVEKWLNKIIPGIFKSIFVGMGTIFIAGSLGFLILGPIGNMLGQVIAAVFMFLNATVGPLAVGLLAAALPWMVMAGMHTALIPFMTQMISKPGYDPIIRPAFILHNMSEGGANIGVALRSKNKEFKSECWSLAIGCIVAGVTEPAIYGVNLKLKKPMYGVMAGGFAGGLVASLLGARAYLMGYSNVLSLPIFENTIWAMVVGVIVSIGVSAIVTFILYRDDEETKSVTKPVSINHSDDDIVAVSDGSLMDISQVSDEAFASKALGDGVALKLANDFICSPANGTLVTLFPTGHAFGVVTKDGVELLVHIGIDTVKAQGNGFNVLINQGDEVKAGQPVVKVDRDKLENENYDLTTILVITDDKDKNIELKRTGFVKSGDKIN